MWIDVHEAMFKLETKVTHNIIKNWICCTITSEESYSLFDYIFNHIEYKSDYYDKLMRILESEFISDTILLLPKVKIKSIKLN